MEQPLFNLPEELLGEIISFLPPKNFSVLASTSTKWNNFVWNKITRVNIPDRFSNPLIIFKKCNPKSVTNLSLDITEADPVPFVETLAAFKWLTNLQVYAPRTTHAPLYDLIFQFTQLKQLDLVDNYLADFQLLTRMSGLRKLTELSLTVENTDFESLPIEDLTFLDTLKFPFSESLDDHCLERIFTLTQLQFLDLTWCSKITHNSFSKIVKMTNLTKLDVSRCLNILAPSFELLADLPRLWCLDLSYHHTLSHQEINIISRHPHLTCLYLVSNNGLQGQSYHCLTQLRNLRELHLEARDCLLHPLTSLTNLRALFTKVPTDRHSIASFTQLEQLNLNEAYNQDATWLRTMTWLKHLAIVGSAFGSVSAKEVTESLLNTTISLPWELIQN